MKIAILLLTFFLGQSIMAEKTDVYSFKVKTLGGQELDLGKYKGKALLFINTASKCGFTNQYKGLQSLHESYQGKNLVLIGVPSNDFGAQEPGSNEEISDFCRINYGVDFQMLAKMPVKGDAKSELFKFLVADGPEIKWNFEKILVDTKGQVAGRFASDVKPLSEELRKAIESVL